MEKVSLEFASENVLEHGVMAPVGKSPWGPSTVATVDADGRRIVFTKLWTGGNASYLCIDAETGQTEQIYPDASGVGAYRILLTPDNIVYDTMGDQMVAIDVPSRTMRALGEIPSGMALSFVRAGDGTVYAGIYPSATLVSYNPTTDIYTNHGALDEASWPQYLRPLAIDASGWIYGGIAIEKTQVVGMNLATGEKKRFISEEKRRRGDPTVYLGKDGQVYAQADGWGWHVMFEGNAMPIDTPPVEAVADGTDIFPDGSLLASIDIPDRELFVQDVGAEESREVRFDYESTGVRLYTMIAGADGNIHGATGIPLRVWRFDPDTGAHWNRGLGGYGGHINQFARQGDVLYGAVYSTGTLLEYDPSKPYDDAPMWESKNPRQVHYADEARDLYGRPSAVLAHSDGRHILVGGSAARVLKGSGLLIYDIETEVGTLLDRSQLIPDQGITALVSLSDDDVLIGTSTRPPTGGGEGTAKTAMIYRLNLKTHTVTGRWPFEPATPAIRDMVVAPDGLVYGLAEPNRLFVFDPLQGEILSDEPITGYGAASGYQAPRCMIVGPDDNIYALFREAVVRIDPGTRAHTAIARPPVQITSGIAICNNRLYFGCISRLFSCAIDV
ncbi:MAG: hypothetical protein HOE48_26570 [Candidatus Latescibacteria bacterium]|nr:hypothetical protein [Candidatus Latescibacterota bacterium]